MPSSSIPSKKQFHDCKVQSKLSVWSKQFGDKLISPKINTKNLSSLVLPTCSSSIILPPFQPSCLSVSEISEPLSFVTSTVKSHFSTMTTMSQSVSSVVKKPLPCATSPAISPSSTAIPQQLYNYDVASYQKQVMKKKDNHDYLIKHVLKPIINFKFPKNNNGRCFRFSWLESFLWLCYSPSTDGAFCISCVLFGHKYPTRSIKVKKLFSEPFTHWPDAIPAFYRHQDSKLGLHSYTYPLFISKFY